MLDALYAAESIDPVGVDAVLSLLAREGIQAEVAHEVARYHDQAIRAIAATSTASNAHRRQLEALVEQLATRTG